MKKIRTEIFVLVLLSLFSGCAKKLDSNIAKASYTLGYQYGQNLKAQKVDFDQEALALGMKEALSGKPSQLTLSEMQQAISILQEEAAKKRNSN